MSFRAAMTVLLLFTLPATKALGRSSPTPQPTATPIAGIPVTVNGTIHALSCLLRQTTVDTELASCSRASLANGAGLGILADGSGRILAIAAESPAGDPAGKAREFITEEVQIQGRLYRRGNFSILVPETIQGSPAARPQNGRR